ncbi:MAG: hypothetical protein H6706_01435 [Myxococcales bacterium]|nr:hypothetical protein [Myxococcales bacterium]
MNEPRLIDLARTRGRPDTPARRHLARIVAAATANPAGILVDTAVRCRRRPGRRRCVGWIATRRQDLPEEIHWSCPACGDGGVARGWRQSPWSFGTAVRKLAEPAADAVAFTLPEPLYRAMEATELPDARTRRVVLGATHEEAGVRLEGAPDVVRRLQRHLASLAGRAASARRRQQVARIARLMARDLGPPPASAPGG